MRLLLQITLIFVTLVCSTQLTLAQSFFSIKYTDSTGTLQLTIRENQLNDDFLYVRGLSTGLGNNDIGLDRGQLGSGDVVYWEKRGNKMMLVQPNLNFRASATNPAEAKSIKQAFAPSVIYGFPIKENQNGKYTIDLTPFLLRDAHGVAKTLKRNNAGAYKVDASRSTIYMENTKAFPDNVEMEALLTFTGTPTGRATAGVAADNTSISLVQHHSFVRLPDDDYQPRKFLPGSGSFYTSWADYSKPVNEDVVQRFITRHRLEKTNPAAARSTAVEPIVYYLDPGTPQPVRDALLDGARWWNQAFEAAGFIDAFQVRMLPEDADPMDLRYNVIQWVHRSTRGWSYGASIIDPRTGEILKGHVSLGSLRIRQDFKIAQGLLEDAYLNGVEDPRMLELALARIRQLSAHEVGHTLGFAHNFAASTNNRSSVMDYPHPVVVAAASGVKTDDAYAVNIGDWDKVTARYSYTQFPVSVDEDVELKKLLADARQAGHVFITDYDSRSMAGAHPTAHLWDNGANAAEELTRITELRDQAMKRFGKTNARPTATYSELEDVFVPVYLMHRYQVEAAAKLIAGQSYTYASIEDTDNPWKSVDFQSQRAAMMVVSKTLSPEFLKMPQSALDLFSPRAYGYNRSRESFASNTGVTFDPIAAANTSAAFALKFLFLAERLNRLEQQRITDTELPGVALLLRELDREILYSEPQDVYDWQLQQAVVTQYVDHVLGAINDDRVSPAVRTVLMTWLEVQEKQFKRGNPFDWQPSSKMGYGNTGDAFAKALYSKIQTFRRDPSQFQPVRAPRIPDGSPIGCEGH